MSVYYIKITQAGLAALAAAEISSTPVVIAQFAVGDANGISYDPTGLETALHHEVWRAAPNRVYIHPLHPTWIVVEAYIPPTDGGFDIRESAIFSADGTLIAIGKYPLTNKPAPGSGSEKELYVRMIFQVTNSTTVEQTIDTSLVFVVQQYVDEQDAAHAGDPGAHPDIREMIADHAEATDPHPQYVTDDVIVAHLISSDPHPKTRPQRYFFGQI